MGSRVVGSWMSSARAGRGSVRAWIGVRLTAVLASIAIAFVGVAWAAPVAAATGAVAASPATNGVPYLVKDIRTSGGSNPSGLTNVAGTLIFTARDATHGRELWRSDGSSAGTRMVKDIRAGLTGSQPHNLAVIGHVAFFIANDGVHGGELWRSDGTSAGTRMVKDIRPGARSSALASLTAVGAKLYFIANDGVHGSELWVSDGTRAGTHLVKDIVAGPGSAELWSLTASAGRLFFTIDSTDTLWRSNGTRAGTKQIQDFGPVNVVYFLVAVDSTVFAFVGHYFCCALWATDGTTSGGQSLSGDWNAFYTHAGLGGRLYFKSGEDIGPPTGYLVRSDGTQEGTEVITPHVMPGIDLTALAGSLFWTDSLGSSTGAENRLWISDGTTAGTRLVLDGGPAWQASLWGAAAVGNTIVFAAGTNDIEPWLTDGTAEGTRPMGDLNPNSSSSPNQFTKVGASVYFVADDGSHGQELWRFVP